MQHDPFSVQSRMLMRQNVNKDFTNGRLKPKHLTAVVERSGKMFSVRENKNPA